MSEENQVSDAAAEERPELALGTRIRAFRQARKLTLRQVSEKAGVSESFLSQVERGASGVSISTLHTIAAALGLTVADLFDATSNNHHRVVHPADRPMIQVPGVRKYMLTRQPLQSLEVLECDYEPGASTGGQGHSHGDSQELFVVLAGSLVVTIDGHAYEMTEGDSIEYRSSSPHAVTNVSDSHARGLFIISPPSL